MSLFHLCKKQLIYYQYLSWTTGMTFNAKRRPSSGLQRIRLQPVPSFLPSLSGPIYVSSTLKICYWLVILLEYHCPFCWYVLSIPVIPIESIVSSMFKMYYLLVILLEFHCPFCWYVISIRVIPIECIVHTP